MPPSANLAWAVNMAAEGITDVVGSPELGGFILLIILAIGMMKFGLDRVAIMLVVVLAVGTTYFSGMLGGTVIWALALILAAAGLSIAIFRLAGEH